MNKDRSRIKPLLAGRIRPRRTPPQPGIAGSARAFLQISHACRHDSASKLHAGSIHRELDVAGAAGQSLAEAAAALRTADAAFLRIRTCLGRLVSTWQNIEREVQEVSSTIELTDAQTELLDRSQRKIDEELAAIDRIAVDAMHAGMPLLDGRCSIMLVCETSDAPRVAQLPHVSCCTLGSEHIEGFVSSLGAAGRNAVGKRRTAGARAVLQSALMQIDSYRDIVRQFLADAIEPNTSVSDIARENGAAAFSTVSDADFAEFVGSISPVDALIAGRMERSVKNPSDFFHFPTIQINTGPNTAD